MRKITCILLLLVCATLLSASTVEKGIIVVIMPVFGFEGVLFGADYGNDGWVQSGVFSMGFNASMLNVGIFVEDHVELGGRFQYIQTGNDDPAMHAGLYLCVYARAGIFLPHGGFGFGYNPDIEGVLVNLHGGAAFMLGSHLAAYTDAFFYLDVSAEEIGTRLDINIGIKTFF